MTAEELQIVRRAYARQIMAAARLVDARLENSLAEIPREGFLGPGPWLVRRSSQGYAPTLNADPVHLYSDVIVAIDPERRISNGIPSFHAHLLAHAKVRGGEHVVHVGAGTGYYSAVMGYLAGPAGRVTAIEFEDDLATRARKNLAGYTNVSVVHGDGATVPFEPADVIYVNAGVTRPSNAWLDGLKDGGRLVLPLTTNKALGQGGGTRRRGAIFLITRKGADFLARWIAPISIYTCVSLRDEASERALAAAFRKGDGKRVRRLYRTDELPYSRCWLKAPGWSLTYD